MKFLKNKEKHPDLKRFIRLADFVLYEEWSFKHFIPTN